MSDQHSRLVQFLEDHERLGELMMADAIFYEPIVRTRPEMIHAAQGARVDSFVKLEGGEGLFIGKGVHIASFAHIGVGGGFTQLGDYSAVASHGVLISGSNQADAISMSASAPLDIQRVKKSFCKLGDYAVVLAGGVVLPGVELGEGAILAAGGVATKSIPAWEIWGGVPARFMRRREVKR